MSKNDLKLLDKIQQTITECIKKPEVYLSIQDNLSQDLKNVTKNLYDIAVKTKLLTNSKSQALSELIVKDFDTEQIWQQLELENNEEFSRLSLGNISKTLASKKALVLPLKLTKDNIDENEDENKSKQSSDNDEDLESEGQLDLHLSDNDNEKDDDGEDDENIRKRESIKPQKKKRRITEVDDKFFKLDELDEYLKKEDKRELNPKSIKKTYDSSDEDDDEEDIDLFNNFPDSEDDEEDDEIKNGNSIKYADFFDSPESDEEEQKKNKRNEDDDKLNENDEDEENAEYERLIQQAKQDHKKVKFNLLSNPDETDSIDNNKEKNKDDDESEDKNNKSTLESRQERLQKRIKELEEEAIAEKPWQLKGETSALNRPQNSLLEEFVEFDSVTRPAPVMTEQTTMKLEDIIRTRIKDKAWDDVEKKIKPVETPMEYKKKLIMNQEKSKESLAQIYENEYIKQREALTVDNKDEQEKEEPPEHIEIKEKIHALFRQLDALSNFHYTPKPAKPEIKIVSNVPAINMEEVAPVATSDATLLAPEEVKSKQKGDLIGKSERTKTDMKRERRKKKLKQHVRAVHKSKQPVDNVIRKKSSKDKVSKIKGRNIINVSEETSKKDNKTIKSSTAFFAQLQDQVVSSIKAKTKPSKKSKNTVSAIKLKL